MLTTVLEGFELNAMRLCGFMCVTALVVLVVVEVQIDADHDGVASETLRQA